MHSEEKERYEVEPDEFFEDLHFEGYDGYEIMAVAEVCGWEALAGWGEAGYLPGDWPYVVVYIRQLADHYLVALYIEGTMQQWMTSDITIRNAIIDDIAFDHWQRMGVE